MTFIIYFVCSPWQFLLAQCGLGLAKRLDNHALSQVLDLHAENETVEFQPYPNERKLERSAKQTVTHSLQPESQSDFSEKRTHYLKYLKQRRQARLPTS